MKNRTNELDCLVTISSPQITNYGGKKMQNADHCKFKIRIKNFVWKTFETEHSGIKSVSENIYKKFIWKRSKATALGINLCNMHRKSEWFLRKRKRVLYIIIRSTKVSPESFPLSLIGFSFVKLRFYRVRR